MSSSSPASWTPPTATTCGPTTRTPTPGPTPPRRTSTFKTSQKFCAPLFYYYGDTYADGSVDPDDDPYWLGVLWDAKIRLVLDGKTIIDSEAKDFWKAWFDPTYFDPPFWYDDEHTQGMAFILGFGYVHEPLS